MDAMDQRTRRQQKRKAGICIDCRELALPDKSRCALHQERMEVAWHPTQDRQAALQAIWARQNRCRACGDKVAPNKRRCPYHLLQGRLARRVAVKAEIERLLLAGERVEAMRLVTLQYIWRRRHMMTKLAFQELGWMRSEEYDILEKDDHPEPSLPQADTPFDDQRQLLILEGMQQYRMSL